MPLVWWTGNYCILCKLLFGATCVRVFERPSVRGIKVDVPVSPGAPAPVTGWCIQQRLGKYFDLTLSHLHKLTCFSLD